MIELTQFDYEGNMISLDPEQIESVRDEGDNCVDPRGHNLLTTRSVIRTKSGDEFGVFESYDVIMEMIRWAKMPKITVQQFVLPKDSTAVLNG